MSTVHRCVYRAQARPGQEAVAAAALCTHVETRPLGFAPGDVMTVSLFQLGRHFFAYWESVDLAVAPAALFGADHSALLGWPGEDAPRLFAPMLDIFHWQSPADVAHWRRKAPAERISGRLARLKPEMASSYIFYHYQLQEEKPGSFDKHCLIGMHENLLFFYQELPAVVEPLPRPGKLTTKNTPDDWHGTMFPHFILWDDAPPGEEIWRQVELLFHVG